MEDFLKQHAEESIPFEQTVAMLKSIVNS